jgi:UDP-N-acetylmuramate--alanine ligase
VVLDIYAASEQPIEGVTAARLVEEINRAGHPSARYVSSVDEASRMTTLIAQQGDLILTLGAGNVYQVGPMILQRLQATEPAAVTP